jgi:hypothetical protein
VVGGLLAKRRTITLVADESTRDACCHHRLGVESAAVNEETGKTAVLKKVSLILTAVSGG